MANKSLKQRVRDRMFKFLTGYDPEMIVLRNEKPVNTEKNIPHSISENQRRSKFHRKTIKDIPMQGKAIMFDHLFKSYMQEQVKPNLYDINQIQNGLNSDINNFVLELMGEPNKSLSTNNQFRYGSKGSMSITLSGAKSGLWYMHEEGRGGNLLQLIQEQKELNFKDALEYAANYLGISKSNSDELPYHKKVYGFSKTIKNTLGEKYLKEHRGITANIDNIRFVPYLYEPTTKEKHPAVVVFSKDMSGDIKGMQAIWLDRETGKKLNIETAKRSYGEIKGSMVPINKGTKGIAVAEGVETALSIASSRSDLTVFAALGSFSNFTSSDIKVNGTPIIMCVDNDGDNKHSIDKVKKSISELSQKGFNVFVAYPKHKGADFNDILKKEGVSMVSKYLDNARLVQSAAPIKENMTQNDAHAARKNKQREQESFQEI